VRLGEVSLWFPLAIVGVPLCAAGDLFLAGFGVGVDALDRAGQGRLLGVDSPGFEVLRCFIRYVLGRGLAEHEDFCWYILEGRADDGDELWEVVFARDLDLDVGGHGCGDFA